MEWPYKTIRHIFSKPELDKTETFLDFLKSNDKYSEYQIFSFHDIIIFIFYHMTKKITIILSYSNKAFKLVDNI